jgi:DeoR/GlpR family transcriptional regulator of sugar metabolism
MQTKNRRKSVLEALQKNKSVSISDLAEQLDVSSITIRRDLNRLAEQGIVTLIYGGAVLNEGTAAIASVMVRERRSQTEKSHIAAFCAELIKESNSVYIDGGSTTKNIAEAVMDRKNIVVLSHSLAVMNVLANAKDIQLISVPGVYMGAKKGFYGQLALDFISNFQLDIAFLGVSGLDIENGITGPDLDDAQIKRILIKKAKRKVIAVDHTKIGKKCFVKACDIRDIDILVTDKQADKKIIEKIRRMDVEVVLV